ncbi:MAG TPA: CocE/NonD family hydrolase [Candidatus Udaeobacter sp.]|nr:CocE/NonD family hydrolase [Candidatus Udaeobacter sp.]
MKEKHRSNTKLAIIGLRLLAGSVAAAFIAFGVASSSSVANTSSCPSGSAEWPSSDPDIMLETDFYWTSPFIQHPVLVFRACNATQKIDGCNFWDPSQAYHVVVQDIRGSPECANTPTPFIGDLLYKFDQDDGHTFIDGVNDSTWCNGNIGMEGTSNGGIVSYLAAVDADPSLRGIQTSYATGDLLNYGLFNGGVLHKEILYPVDLAQPPNQISWKDYVGLGIWDKYLITDQDAGRTHVAGLHVGGWFDVFGQGLLDTSSRMQKNGGFGSVNNQKVVIGPWIHTGVTGGDGYLAFPSPTPTNPSLLDYDSAWKQCVFGAGPTPCAAWGQLKAVKVYRINATPGTEWTTYDTWPPPSKEVKFYFTSTHGLSGDPPRVNGQQSFMSDPANPCPTLGGTNNLNSCISPSPVPSPMPCGSFDQRPIENRQVTPGDVVVFTSDSLPNGGTVVGRIHADIYIKTSLPDVDVFVRMTDVFPDGHSMLMAQGIQRARYRNGACPQLLTNQATLIPVDLSSTAWVLQPGHKLRVIVSASAGPNHPGGDPIYSVNPQNGDEYIGLGHLPRVGTINVLVGPSQQSVLFVPQPLPMSTPPDRRPPKPTPCP